MFGGNMAKMMQQAQQMKQNIKTAQAQADALEINVSHNNQLSITINGKYQITSLSLDDAILADKALLSQLLITTINDANKKIHDQTQALMKEATGGIDLPL